MSTPVFLLQEGVKNHKNTEKGEKTAGLHHAHYNKVTPGWVWSPLDQPVKRKVVIALIVSPAVYIYG